MFINSAVKTIGSMCWGDFVVCLLIFVYLFLFWFDLVFFSYEKWNYSQTRPKGKQKFLKRELGRAHENSNKELESYKSNITKTVEKLKHIIFAYTHKLLINLSRSLLISLKSSIHLYKPASCFELLTGILRFLILWFIIEELSGHTTLTSEGMHWLCRFRPITKCLNH